MLPTPVGSTGRGYGNTAALESMRAANSTYTPNYMEAGASLLSGASTLSEKWHRFQMDRGPFNPEANVSGFNGNGPMGPTGRA